MSGEKKISQAVSHLCFCLSWWSVVSQLAKVCNDRTGVSSK